MWNNYVIRILSRFRSVFSLFDVLRHASRPALCQGTLLGCDVGQVEVRPCLYDAVLYVELRFPRFGESRK